MTRRAMWVAATAATAGLVAGGAIAPVSGAATLRTKTVTVKPSGKKARFALTSSGTTVYLSMSKRQSGKWVRVARVKVPRKLPEGATVRPLRVFQTGEAYEANGGQGQVTYDGTSDYSVYFGWNLAKRKLEIFK